ncbi:MAG: SpoIIE family protein phosphatase [Candidatus Aminicenantales bacterium]|jgi:serine phosphatase RsbU (regulator of sigma subunit)
MTDLFIYPKKGDPWKFPLGQKKVSIGRSPTSDIVLPDQFTSGCHATISATDGGYILEDQASKNGTFLNGPRITGDVVLTRGDKIHIGETDIFFDREYEPDVKIIEGTTFTHSSNTIINIKDILKKPPTAVFLKPAPGGPDMARLQQDQKFSAVLSEVSQALIYHMKLPPLLDHIMDLIIQYIPMDRGVLMLKEGPGGQLVHKVVRIHDGPLRNLSILVSKSIIRTALDKNSAVLISDIQSDEQLRGQVSVIQAQIHSAMCVPLWSNEEIIGLIYCDRAALLGQFTEEDLKLLTLLANLAANKIENAKLIEKDLERARLDQEMKTAAVIQKNFLPKNDPVFDPYEISGSMRACRHVGGDYYDFIPVDPARLGLVVADVSGMGVSAALLMASLRASLHAEIPVTKDLALLAAKLNDFVHMSSDSHSFISFFFGFLDRQAGEVAYVNAGHNPPLIVNPAAGARYLESTGFCLGMFPSVSFEIRTTRLEPGEILCLFTDGIVEHVNGEKEQFGEDRLAAKIRESAGLPAREIIDRIYDEVISFAGCDESTDDMTLVIVRRKS